MKNLYVISGVTGMTGSELSRQFVSQGHTVIGFDNFFASSIDTVKDIIDNPSFIFYNYDINKVAQMDEVCDKAKELKIECDGRLVFINCAARFANVYSRHERFAEHIIPHIIDNLLESHTVTLLENSKVNKRTFLHNIDSCRAVMELIASEDALDGTVYNVATEEEIAIIDLVKTIAIKMGINDVDIRFEGYRKSDPERRLLNTDKIRTRTSWKPIITLDEGLTMCVSGIKK